MQKNEVKSLIESIKSQTEQLKNTVRNCVGTKKITATSPNSNEPSIKPENSNKRISRKKLNHEISEVVLRHDEDEINFKENNIFPKKHKISEDLLEENNELKGEVNELKNIVVVMINQYKLLQKELEEMKRKASKVQVLEHEYLKEKKKNQSLHERNFELKKQALNLVNKIKVFLNAREKEDNENLQESISISAENQLLRDLLQSPLNPQNNPKGPTPSQKSSENIQSFKETYKKIKEERKDLKEKQRLEEKNKEKSSQFLSYFQNTANSQSDLLEQNAIIDMYEEKILQNSIKVTTIGPNNSVNNSMSSSSSIGSLDKSPKLAPINIKKK